MKLLLLVLGVPEQTHSYEIKTLGIEAIIDYDFGDDSINVGEVKCI